ncbi:hypothetical protein D3C80_1630650 [compost metagenome]
MHIGQRMADCLRRGIFHSNIAFAGCVLLRNKGMLAARHLGRDNLAYALTGMVGIGQDDDSPAFHSQRNFGNHLAVNCRTARLYCIGLHRPLDGYRITFAFHYN